MVVIRKIKKMQEFSEKQRRRGKVIGFVPTMGYLHAGHVKLIRESKKENDITVVSIFVNPTQFGPNEDYERYPRDEKRDLKICESEGVDVVFIPDVREVYTEDFETYVEVKELQKPLCGVSRPTHFRGVATVVTKLFNIVKPHNAYFGLKDYQQSLIVRKLVRDLNFDIKIKTVETVRDDDGLALSSRNEYLKGDERKKAVAIPLSLLLGLKLIFKDRIKSAPIVEQRCRDFLKKNGVNPDYFEIRDAHTLSHKDEEVEGDFVMAAAGYIGNARLIDNVVVLNKNGKVKIKNFPKIKNKRSLDTNDYDIREILSFSEDFSREMRKI